MDAGKMNISLIQISEPMQRRQGGSEPIARFMTGVLFTLFANDMTGVNLAGLLPPFSGKVIIMGFENPCF
jgi:hypothetical protein